MTSLYPAFPRPYLRAPAPSPRPPAARGSAPRRRRRVVLDQARDCLSRLCADSDPILNSLVLQIYLSRAHHRIVRAEILNVLAVALRTLLFYDQAVERLTFRPDSHQN